MVGCVKTMEEEFGVTNESVQLAEIEMNICNNFRVQATEQRER